MASARFIELLAGRQPAPKWYFAATCTKLEGRIGAHQCVYCTKHKLGNVLMTTELRIPARLPHNYRDIVEWLAEEVNSGRLAAGERLPTQRNLAHRLGVAVATVGRAYGELARRGYVRGEVGRGSFIRRQSDRPACGSWEWTHLRRGRRHGLLRN